MRALILLLQVLLATSLLCLNWVTWADESASGDKMEHVPDTNLQILSAAFFKWRSLQQPAQGDDILRVERPERWVPDYSPEAIAADLEQYNVFLESFENLTTSGCNTSDQLDAWLLKAAMQRVYWELEILKTPRRNPLFYVNQTLGSVFELLIISSPMTLSRAENIILRLEQFPVTLKHARKNLDLAIRPFAQAAIHTLADIEPRLQSMEAGLDEVFPESLKPRLHKAIKQANSALHKYSGWLESRLDKMQTAFAVGPGAYSWFLVNVALIPYTPDELLAQARQAWNRSVVSDVLERNRNRDVPQQPLFPSSDRQVQASLLRENEIRAFLESQDLMTVPDWLMTYRVRAMPAYLEPLAFMGVTDDLTSATRLDEDGYSYIPEPSSELPYFALSAARDPRPLMIHEGIPGHYYQLALSWSNPNLTRRHYIDSSINEGIAFYVEELLLQAGIFDFSPRSREVIYSFARLRALRVEIDIRLAVGDFTIEQAADYLARSVPMDLETAREEAVYFALNPGQAISYQVGKLQILEFLADASTDQAEKFSLREFHDYLMLNGNVPIALQRWEYLGRENAVLRLDALGGKPVTVPQ
jgi:uncharacterized protein (DUF885 family)